MKLILKSGMCVLYKNGMPLTGMNIKSIVAESKDDRADLRMLLTGSLKMVNAGCHALGRSFEGVEFDSMFHHDLDSSNYRAGANDKSQGLDDKLKIVESLTTALNYGENIGDDNRKLLSEKLKSIVEIL